MSEPLASIVVSTIDGYLPRLRRLVVGVLRHTVVEYELIVVDGATTDGTAAWLASMPRVHVVRLATKPTAAIGANAGFSVAKGRYVTKLDTDTVVRGDGWLRGAIRALECDPNAGVAGDIWCVGSGGTAALKAGREDTSRLASRWWDETPTRANLPHCQGGAMVFVGAVLRKIGGINERYQHSFDDVEMSWVLLSRGWKLICAPRFCCCDTADRLARRVQPSHIVIHPVKEVPCE